MTYLFTTILTLITMVTLSHNGILELIVVTSCMNFIIWIMSTLFDKFYVVESKINNKSIHITGAFGRGKTFEVMNNSFENLLGLQDSKSIEIRHRIKNTNNLELEYCINADESVPETTTDVLYFSALGKTQEELLSEINHELSFGFGRLFSILLLNFKLQKINSTNLFNELDKKIKRKNINLIILDDLERMSDIHHDLEINKIIRLILQIQKRYDLVVITALDTRKNKIIKPNHFPNEFMEEWHQQLFKNVEFIVDDFGNENFRMKFSKVKFTKFTYIPDDIDIVNEIREKYVSEIEANVMNRFQETSDYAEVRKLYEERMREEIECFLIGDIRSIEKYYETLLATIISIPDDKLLDLFRRDLPKLLRYYMNVFYLTYDKNSEASYTNLKKIMNEAPTIKVSFDRNGDEKGDKNSFYI